MILARAGALIGRRPFIAVSAVFLLTTMLAGAGAFWFYGSYSKVKESNKGLVAAIEALGKEREARQAAEDKRQAALNVLAIQLAGSTAERISAFEQLNNSCLDARFDDFASLFGVLYGRAETAGILRRAAVDGSVSDHGAGSAPTGNASDLSGIADRIRRAID